MSFLSTVLLNFVVLLCLCACSAPVTQPFKPATQPPQWQSDVITASDGTMLAMRTWLPEPMPPKAIVIGLHGFNDYSYAYRRVGEALRAEGIAVIAYDQRGYGHSGAFGIWPGQENLLRDAGDVVRAVQAHYPTTPLYVMGESMGGAVALLATKQGALPPNVSGIILVAPALWGGQTMGWLYRAPLWLTAHSFPSWKVGGGNLNIRPSDNMEMLRELTNDALVIKKSRMDTLYGIVQLMDNAYQGAENLPFPTLLLYGAHDQIIPKRPISDALKRLTNARVVYYPRGFHMLTRDLNANAVNSDIAAWVLNPSAPLPSGFDDDARRKLADDL